MKWRGINHLPCYLSPSQRLDGRVLATEFFPVCNERLLGYETAVDLGAPYVLCITIFPWSSGPHGGGVVCITQEFGSVRENAVLCVIYVIASS